jgi:hypothetical protein
MKTLLPHTNQLLTTTVQYSNDHQHLKHGILLPITNIYIQSYFGRQL